MFLFKYSFLHGSFMEIQFRCIRRITSNTSSDSSLSMSSISTVTGLPFPSISFSTLFF